MSIPHFCSVTFFATSIDDLFPTRTEEYAHLKRDHVFFDSQEHAPIVKAESGPSGEWDLTH